MVKPLTAWSYSRYATYQTCPLKLKLSAIDRIQEPKGPALVRGSDVHKLAETYLRGNLRAVPAELKMFADVFKGLRKVVMTDPDAQVEGEWAFRADWTRTRWDDWDGCRVRAKVDLVHSEGDVIVVTDWKTGKFREDSVAEYAEQLELYALAALLVYAGRPNLTVHPRLMYVDSGIIHGAGVYAPGDVARLKKLWERRARPLLNDRTFAPKPNRFCSWCHYRNDNKANGGGQCRF